MNRKEQPCLVVVAGPTAIGKTALSISLAKHFQTAIISADSRQLFRELKIGSAQPTEEEMEGIQHHFLGSHSVHQTYNVSDFEKDVLATLDELFIKHRIVIMTGGSGMYINAVLNGMDDLPGPDTEIREALETELKDKGLDALQQELQQKDPELFDQMDIHNPQRVLRALEVIRISGKKFSELRKKEKKERPFRIHKILLDMDRETLYERINQRVDEMIAKGLIDEAKNLFAYQHLNALQTVGYRELFRHFKGEISKEEAISLIKQNTRRYAKRQLTWFRNDEGYQTFHPSEEKKIIQYIETSCGV